MSEIKFRNLNAEEIECRIGTATEKGVSLLLYKTARVDMAILDETLGAFNWKNSYEVVNGNLYCTISIYDREKKEWIEKCDCGTESKTEAEKGEASDAFKRAGFRVGIGRALYTAPFIWVNGATKTDRFEVKEIGYAHDGSISRLSIFNSKTGVLAFQWGKPTKSADNVSPETLAKAKSLGINPDAVASYLKKNIYELTDQDLEWAIAKKEGKC